MNKKIVKNVIVVRDLFFAGLILCTVSSFSVFGQGPISWINYLNQIPNNLVLTDTIKGKDIYTLDFRDSINGITLQQYITNNGEYSINYFDFNHSNRDLAFSNRMDFDSLNRMRVYSYSIKDTHLSYKYYENGQLEYYAYIIEDSLTLNKPAKDRRVKEESFVIEFYPNGVIKKHYFFVDGPQKVIEYWPNGRIKSEAEMLVQWNRYCGSYIEYDLKGNVQIKGNYRVIDSSIPTHQKTGVWKYFENGKLIKKEKY